MTRVCWMPVLRASSGASPLPTLPLYGFKTQKTRETTREIPPSVAPSASVPAISLRVRETP